MAIKQPAGGLHRAGLLRRRLIPVGALRRRPAPRICGPSCADLCPGLAEAVRMATRAAGVPAPDGMCIGPNAAVDVVRGRWPRRRIVLRIGLPLLMALPAEDVAVLAAHRLAILAEPYPRSAVALFRRREAMELRSLIKLPRRRAAAVARFLADTDRFARDVRLRADTAALAAAGSGERAVRILLRASALDSDLMLYSLHFFALAWERAIVPANLYTGWIAVRGPEAQAWETLPRPKPTAFADQHPGLGTLPDDVSHHLVPIGHGDGRAPACAAVPPATEAKLALRYPLCFGVRKTVSALPSDEIDPGAVYGEDGAKLVDDELRAAAEKVLGREPSRLEVLDLLLGPDRGRLEAEYGALLADEFAEDGDDDPCPVEFHVAHLVCGALVERGWRRLDVLRRERLTGPDAETFDVGPLVTRAFAAKDGMSRLRDLLAGKD